MNFLNHIVAARAAINHDQIVRADLDDVLVALIVVGVAWAGAFLIRGVLGFILKVLKKG